MSPRKLLLASVSAVFLAACAAASGNAAAATPSDSAQLASSAYQALSAGDPTTAVDQYTKAIESGDLTPAVLANAFLNRGLAYQRLNQHNEAVSDYTAALRIDQMTPKLRAMALYNRGLSYQKLQQPALAMEDYTGALFIDHGFAHAYYSRANLLRASGQNLFALQDYEKALASGHPDPARVHYGEALTYEAMNRPDNVREELTKALAANPDFAPAKDKLASLSTTPVTETADQIVTASVEQDVPAKLGQLPVAPATKPHKKSITDRIPVQDEQAPPQDEKVVAIEPAGDSATPAAEDTQPAVEQVASADAAPAATEEAAPAVTGWTVQIASAGTEDAAWSTFKKMQAKYSVLADKKPVVVKADLGAKGTFYRVRLTGYDEQDGAKSACSKLKAKGVRCFVSKAAS
ncbi:SPOR domain-containing protein [Aestuariivirga sp.]|uniref:SPOR domain-containing protein n=1 Tax=Aestuariivirga sp. TaxID=2650926 RepID=UPI0039E5CCB0